MLGRLFVPERVPADAAEAAWDENVSASDARNVRKGEEPFQPLLFSKLPVSRSIAKVATTPGFADSLFKVSDTLAEVALGWFSG